MRNLLTTIFATTSLGTLITFSIFLPNSLPALAMALLIAAWWPLGSAWKACRGLALRPAIGWASLALALGMAAQVQGWNEPWQGGRPLAGHWAYLASLATLAALISVLGARSPGGGAWALLMGMLVVVFLLPWLEGSGLVGGTEPMDRLRLDAPWSLFFALLGLTGVSNFLPTRRFGACVFVGASFVAEFLGLTATGWPPGRRAACWSLGPALIASGLIVGGMTRGLAPRSKTSLGRLWLWFRDAWGVVWALRVRERFNASAEAAGWSVRLAWIGPVSPDGRSTDDVPEAAEKVLAALLRRFATPSQIEIAARGDAAGACSEDPLERS